MKRAFLFISLFVIALMARAADVTTLTISDIEFDLGDTSYFTITVTADQNINDYTAFEFDLKLPAGLTIPYNYNEDEEEYGYGYFDESEEEWVKAITCPAAKSSHTIGIHQQPSGAWRFLVTDGSWTNKVFKSNSTLLQLIVKPTAEVQAGVFDISFSTTDINAVVKLSKPDETFTVPATVNGKCRISTTLDFVMTAVGWGTWIMPFAGKVPAGLTAHECPTVGEHGILTLTDISAGGDIEANTPYIMEGTADTYSFKGAPEPVANLTKGVLTGTYADINLADDTSYVLQLQGETVAFYQIDPTKPVTLTANHCFMTISGAAKAPAYYLNEVTRVESLLDERNGSVYDMSGRKVEAPAQKGVYLINNKKYYVK